MLERIAEAVAVRIGFRFAAAAVAAVLTVAVMAVAYVIALWSDVLGDKALSTFGIALLVLGAVYFRLVTRR
jgi:hypothetical protein